MLTQLQILNFQNQSRQVIDFDPNVTVLTGPSDSGKSAVIRALRWACTNTPAGDAFIQDGKKDVGVRLKIAGRTIERRKGSKGNEYRIDGKKFKSFGSNVPEPIADFLNLSEVTWQGQHDAPFWLAETAGQVGRELNAVVNLESIDAALLMVNRLTTKAKVSQEAAQDRLKGATEASEASEWVEVAKADMGELEASHSIHEGLVSRFGRLYTLFADVLRERLRADHMRAAKEAMNEVVKDGERIGCLTVEGKKLSGIIEEAAELEGIEAPDMAELEDSFELMERKRLDFEQLDAALRDLKLARRVGLLAKAIVTKQAAELAEELEGRCPLCGAETGDLA